MFGCSESRKPIVFPMASPSEHDFAAKPLRNRKMPQHSANMGPKMAPRWILNRWKFDVEIDDEMVSRWISEDSKFIKSALGVDAELILRKQQDKYGKKTLKRRIYFLQRLFDLFINDK